MSDTAPITVQDEQVSYHLARTHADSGSSVTERIVIVFDCCFSTPEGLNTRLVGGHEEPYYRPTDGAPGSFHQIEFTRDYAASALHEVAHWCVAGAERRRQPDYGYWYAPDGRSATQQAEFERVEVKPQALEWIFSVACGLRFRVSADNLDAGLGPSDVFKRNIWLQVQRYCEGADQGIAVINRRAMTFARALASAFGASDPLCVENYRLEDLG